MKFLTNRCSAAKLAQKLPEESKIKWRKRLEVEYLVLLDWLSSSSKMQSDSHLQYLRTIILEVVLRFLAITLLITFNYSNSIDLRFLLFSGIPQIITAASLLFWMEALMTGCTITRCIVPMPSLNCQTVILMTFLILVNFDSRMK